MHVFNTGIVFLESHNVIIVIILFANCMRQVLGWEIHNYLGLFPIYMGGENNYCEEIPNYKQV